MQTITNFNHQSSSSKIALRNKVKLPLADLI